MGFFIMMAPAVDWGSLWNLILEVEEEEFDWMLVLLCVNAWIECNLPLEAVLSAVTRFVYFLPALPGLLS